MNTVIGCLRKPYDFILRRIYSNSETQHVISTSTESVKRANVLNSILSPFETYVVSLQSLLIWERPFLSAGAFVTVNIIYWLIVSWNRRFFSILSIFAVLLFCYRIWVVQIWPKIQEPSAEGEVSESWVTLKPDVLSVPELSRYLNEFCEKMLSLWKDVWKLRKENHGLFCALMCGFFTIIAVIGKVIPGVLIVYSTVLFLSLGPGVALHLIPSTLYDQMIGYFAELDEQGTSESSKHSGQSDRDSDLEEFVPETSAEVLRHLSLKEEVPDIPSPGMVLTESPSQGYDSLQDIGCSGFNDSDEFSLYSGLGGFPSVEEECESELEEEISDDIFPITEPEKTEMHFVPSHFKEDSSESDNEAVFTEGLSFSSLVGKAPLPVLDSVKEQATNVSAEVGEREVSFSSELDDELMDFEILEESDILS